MSRDDHAKLTPLLESAQVGWCCPVMEVLAGLAVVICVASGVLFIVSGARERRAAPLQARERTGVGRIAIGITLLGVVFLGVLWIVGEAFGTLATV